LLLAACSPKPVPTEPLRAVRTVTVGAVGQAAGHEYAAEIKARTETPLGFRVPGKLVSRLANNGDAVRAGQALAHLDPVDLQLGQQAARAEQVAAQTNLDQLEADLRRYRSLFEQGFIGAAELERRDASVKGARAQLDQAKAQTAAQTNQAAYASLTAPAAGVVTAVLAEPGQVLTAGTPVLRLAQDGPRDAVFSVPEDGVAAIRALLGKPQALTLTMWGQASSLPATVREVAAAADPVTRTFQVKADLGNATVRLGQTGTLKLPGAGRTSAFRLPLPAVWESKGQSQVWVFDRAAGAVRQQAVVVAGADGNWVLVAQGLKAGDEVVSAGTHVLTPGQKVRPYAEPASAASATAH
jgi:RND family efflux transporter MFP subunit